MSYLSIFLFFVYSYGLGFTATSFVKNSGNFLERNLMRIGIGLPLITLIGLALNLAGLPIDWKIILAASIAYPAYYLIRNFRKFNFSIEKLRVTKTDLGIFVMLLIFAGTLYIYLTGAFNYPYLEDDDPWAHAIGAKYVAMEKTVYGQYVHYLEPYPPAYDMLMGILHQTNNSVYWTLKFFNALIISLSIVFFYFFVKQFSGSRSKALFATFALASLPSFLSHFIWAIALAMPLYFVSFYAVERIAEDRKWWITAGLVMAAVLTSSPTHSTYFGLFFVLYLSAKMAVEKKILLYHILAGFGGILLSFALWWLPMILRHGIAGTIAGTGYRTAAGLSIEGTADRVYSFNDFFAAKTTNMINNPIGIGVALFLLVFIALAFLVYRYFEELKKNKFAVLTFFLAALGLLLFFLSRTYIKYVRKRGVVPLPMGSVPFSEFLSDQRFVVVSLAIMAFVAVLLFVASFKDKESKKKYLPITFAWLIFSFYAVNAGPYYFKLSPFRAWMLLAIPISILAAEGLLFLFEVSSRYFFVIAGLLEISFIFYKVYTNMVNQQLNQIVYYNLNWFLTLFFIPLLVILCFLIYHFIPGLIKSQENLFRMEILFIIIFLIFVTSLVPKYTVNTAQWPPGGFWTSNEEIAGFIWMKDNLPANTKVFSFVNDATIIGMDKLTCAWCDDIKEFQKNGINESASGISSFLKSKGYKYLVIEGQFAIRYGINETNNKLNDILSSGLFKPVYQTNGAIVFQVA